VVRSCDPLKNFGGFSHITGTAEPDVVKICTQLGNINSSNRMTYHQQKGHGDAVCHAGLSATADLLVL